MPLCCLYTNIPDKELNDGVEERIANRIAEVLNKPVERVSVVLVPGVRVYRLGSTQPALSMTIRSIGVFDKDRNPGYTSPIKDIIMKEMTSLTPERIVVVYEDLDKDMVGV